MAEPEFAYKVLIVEDDPHIRELIDYHLSRAGYECLCVATDAGHSMPPRVSN